MIIFECIIAVLGIVVSVYFGFFIGQNYDSFEDAMVDLIEIIKNRF